MSDVFDEWLGSAEGVPEPTFLCTHGSRWAASEWTKLTARDLRLPADRHTQDGRARASEIDELAEREEQRRQAAEGGEGVAARLRMKAEATRFATSQHLQIKCPRCAHTERLDHSAFLELGRWQHAQGLDSVPLRHVARILRQLDHWS